MIASSDRFGQIEPRLVRRQMGGWLAVSPSGAPLTIGVEAASVDEARSLFAVALRRWTVLLDEQAREQDTTVK